MIILFLFRLLIPHFDELVINPITRKPSSKNMFAVLGFYVGVLLTIAVTIAGILQHKEPDWTVVLPLTLNGLGLSFLKVYQQQVNRKTADEDGALAKPMPPDEEIELMPQPINPT